MSHGRRHGGLLRRDARRRDGVLQVLLRREVAGVRVGQGRQDPQPLHQRARPPGPGCAPRIGAAPPLGAQACWVPLMGGGRLGQWAGA